MREDERDRLIRSLRIRAHLNKLIYTFVYYIVFLPIISKLSNKDDFVLCHLKENKIGLQRC
jgi:hypothetical protein